MMITSQMIYAQCKHEEAMNSDDDVISDVLTEEAIEFCRSTGSSSFRVSQISSGNDLDFNEAIRLKLKELNRTMSSEGSEIRKWCVLSESFTIKGGELGPTLKLRRKAILSKYFDLIERIYANEDSDVTSSIAVHNV